MTPAVASERVDARRLGQAEHHDTLAARNTCLAPGDTLAVRIRRSDGSGIGDVFQQFAVPYQKWMRVLDALNWIADNCASDLAYRWLCGSKMCGTCAVRMNGREVLLFLEDALRDDANRLPGFEFVRANLEKWLA